MYAVAALTGGLFGGMLALAIAHHHDRTSLAAAGPRLPAISRVMVDPGPDTAGTTVRVDTQASARLRLKLMSLLHVSADKRLASKLIADDPEARRVFAAGLTEPLAVASVFEPTRAPRLTVDLGVSPIDATPDTAADDDPPRGAAASFIDDGSPSQPLAFGQATDETTAASEPVTLFNSENGLRGFMAHNWLSQRFGVQGGLAIKEEKLRQNTLDFRDNVAIGMGFLFAF